MEFVVSILAIFFGIYLFICSIQMTSEGAWFGPLILAVFSAFATAFMLLIVMELNKYRDKEPSREAYIPRSTRYPKHSWLVFLFGVVTLFFILLSTFWFIDEIVLKRKLRNAVEGNDMQSVLQIVDGGYKYRKRSIGIRSLKDLLLRLPESDARYKEGIQSLCAFLGDRDDQDTSETLRTNAKKAINEIVLERISKPFELQIHQWIADYDHEAQDKGFKPSGELLHVSEGQFTHKENPFTGKTPNEIDHYLESIGGLVYTSYQYNQVGVYVYESTGKEYGPAEQPVWDVWLVDHKEKIITAHNTFIGAEPEDRVTSVFDTIGHNPSSEVRTWLEDLPVR